jgi:hypothetical protein
MINDLGKYGISLKEIMYIEFKKTARRKTLRLDGGNQ